MNFASASSRLSRSPFQNSAPAASIANSIFSGFWMSAVEVALGRSSLTALVSKGAVTMKITSSTSTTSINGTMLISAIGWDEAFRSKLAKAMAVLPLDLRHGGERDVAWPEAAALAGLQRAAHRQE